MIISMSKTVSQLTPEALRQYDPTRNLDKILDSSRWEKAQAKLPTLISVLREQFGATHIKVFGSLTNKQRYTRRSDIDIAVWGVLPERLSEAIEVLNELSQDIKVDLVDPQYCRSETLKKTIEEEGIEL